jgi:hypothetical protein
VILFDQVELPDAGEIKFRYHSPGSRKILQGEKASFFPGDNAGPIPSYGSGKRWAAAHFGTDYEKSDWWKTGSPSPAMTDWTDAEKSTADLLLQSFSLAPSKRESRSGYQDYRMPATYLDQIYPNAKKTDIVTILYPRSPAMKANKKLPVITEFSDESSLAVQVERAGKQYLLAVRGPDGKASVGELAADADFACVALDAEGAPAGFILINGEELSFGSDLVLNADHPLLAVASFEADRVRIIFDTEAPGGADLRVKILHEPLRISFNGVQGFASLTPKNRLAEFHIPSGRTEVVVEYKIETE